MNSVEIENLWEKLSMVDLFDSIDNVSKSNDENDKIMNQIKDKLAFVFSSQLKKKREKEKREAMVRRYREYLEGLQTLIKMQMKSIDYLIEEDSYDISDTFIQLKRELIDYSMQVYKLDMLDMSQVLNKKEQRIYRCIHLYDFLVQYNNPTGNSILAENKKQDSRNKKLDINVRRSFMWKTYFYLIINLEKQKSYNRTYISYFMKKYNHENDNELYLKISDYYAADFQGQFSKNIYCQRKKLKLTQKQLQERSGVDRTMIAKIEKVQQPTTLETAIKLLSALNLGIAIYPITGIKEKHFIQ